MGPANALLRGVPHGIASCHVPSYNCTQSGKQVGIGLLHSALLGRGLRKTMGITKEMAHLARTGRWEVPDSNKAGASKPGSSSMTSKPSTGDVIESAVVLEPVHEVGAEVFLFFFPGGLTASDAYVPLAKEIQAASDLRLWIAISAAVPSDFTPDWLERSLDQGIETVKKKGFGAGKVFVGGHSIGAWLSRSLALRRAEGFIQTGSCLWGNPDNLAQYPKPVLTIVGELDGQITVATAAAHAGQILDVEPDLGEYNTVANKPVVIVQGMNHAQISHGIPNKGRGDLDAEISIEEARSHVAKSVASFLVVNCLPVDDPLRAPSLTYLTQVVRSTENRYRPFWEAINQQGEGPKHWQLKVAAVPDLTERNVSVVQHDYVDNFIYSKPSIDEKQERVVVHSFLKPLNHYAVMKNIWVKMKSSEAVSVRFSREAVEQDTRRLAASFNEETFAKALQLVPEDTRKKFLERGKKLRFIDDLLITKSSLEWIDGDLSIQDATDGSGLADVQSPVMITGVTGMPPRFAGMHYMKLMTVARAFQWILVDAYR